MDFSLSTEERAIRDWVRTFVDREIRPLEQEALRRERKGETGVSREQMRELQEKARAAGFWGVLTPEEYGGMGLGAVMAALMEVELGRSFVQFRFGGTADNILFHADQEQRERYLRPTIEGELRSCFAITEPGAGSDAKAIRTSARRDGGEWVINGEKTFITGGHEADFALVFAVTDSEKRSRGGITAFFVDADSPGYSVSRLQKTMSPYQKPAELTFENVEVPEENVLGEVGYGFYSAVKGINGARMQISANALGVAEYLLNRSMEYANDRVAFERPISANQFVQGHLVDSYAELEMARLMVYKCADDIDNGADGRKEAALAKLVSTEMVNRVADRAIQVHGGNGFMTELGIEVWAREVRAMRLYEGTSEILRTNIAKTLGVAG